MTNKTQKARGVNSVGGLNPPPKETRWKKGCPSPNPSGRTRTAEISQVAREALGREDPKDAQEGTGNDSEGSMIWFEFYRTTWWLAMTGEAARTYPKEEMG